MAIPAWRRLSIKTKLPIALGAILALTSGGIVAAAYIGVRAAVLAVAADRLEHADEQVVALLLPAVRQREAALAALATSPQLVDFALHPETGADATLRTALMTYEGAVAGGSIEVWGDDGGRLIALGEARPPMGTAEADRVRAATAAGVVVEPFFAEGQSRAYAVHAAIRQGNRVAGYLVERRRVVSGNGQGVAVITGLIGSGVQLLIGNAAGDAWSDARGTPVPAPPVTLTTKAMQLYRRPGGEAVVARSVAFPDTPWVIALEFPQATILAPARRFLLATTAVAIFVTALGALGGWWLSRRLTTPIVQMTSAAEAIAAERSASRIANTRADEIGRLAAAFNTMADEIDGHRHVARTSIEDLERRVSERTADLEQSNRDLESFSYSVSHDLRAPLRSISGYSKILIDDYGTELSSEARQCLDTVIRKTTEMGQLIDDLLSLSRLGRQAVVPLPLNMTALAESVAADVRAAEPSRSLSIVIEPLPLARGDRALIRQVLVNYLMNAAKFTRTQPHANVVVSGARQGASVTYAVQDNGVGFDMKYVDKLFGVFQRLHHVRDFEGTGVGLAIVRRIIERHGGRAWATSAPGQGATFYVTLPAGDEPCVATTEPSEDRAPARSTGAPAVAY